MYEVSEEKKVCSAVDKFCSRFRSTLQTAVQAFSITVVEREAPRHSSTVFIVQERFLVVGSSIFPRGRM